MEEIRKLNLMKYRAFIKVVELKSITRAAKALGYSQPGISHMLDALESETGFPLLTRTRDSIKPTEDGEKLLYYFQQMVHYDDALQDTIASINGLLTGVLKVGAFNSLMLRTVPKLVSEFTGIHSQIEVHLLEKAYADMLTGLTDGSLDMAFMNDNVPRGFEFYPLFDDPVVAAMKSDHPFAAYEAVPVKAFNGCDFILPASGWDDIYDLVQKQKPFTPNPKHYVASDNAGIAMASDGLGIYLLTKLQADHLPETVTYRPLEEGYYRTLGICIKSLKHAGPALKEFVKMARARLGQM